LPPSPPSPTGKIFYRNEQESLINIHGKRSKVSNFIDCIFVSRFLREGLKSCIVSGVANKVCGKTTCKPRCPIAGISLSYKYEKGVHLLIIGRECYTETAIWNNIETSTSLLDENGLVLRQKLEIIFTKHRTGFHESPLISGCLNPIGNSGWLSSSLSYYSCKVKLINRQPIRNPWSSGGEREYFLIGKVLVNECKEITLDLVKS
jgi:hypothetical protein